MRVCGWRSSQSEKERGERFICAIVAVSAERRTSELEKLWPHDLQTQALRLNSTHRLASLGQSGFTWTVRLFASSLVSGAGPTSLR